MAANASTLKTIMDRPGAPPSELVAAQERSCGTASVGSQSDREHTTVSQADTAGTIAHVTSVGPPVGAVKPYIRFYYRGLGDLVTF